MENRVDLNQLRTILLEKSKKLISNFTQWHNKNWNAGGKDRWKIIGLWMLVFAVVYSTTINNKTPSNNHVVQDQRVNSVSSQTSPKAPQSANQLTEPENTVQGIWFMESINNGEESRTVTDINNKIKEKTPPREYLKNNGPGNFLEDILIKDNEIFSRKLNGSGEFKSLLLVEYKITDAFQKHVDIIRRFEFSEEDIKKPLHGIYELNGDDLKVCIGWPGHPRPSEFRGISKKQVLLTLKKQTNSPENAIIGRWRDIASENTLEFFKDGTVITTRASGKYKFLNKDRLLLELTRFGEPEALAQSPTCATLSNYWR